MDLARSINFDASIKINTWADDDGKMTYWHSSAHLMAEAIEEIYPGTKFGIGPAIENGFYYDIDTGERKLTQDDLNLIEKRCSNFPSGMLSLKEMKLVGTLLLIILKIKVMNTN